MLDFALSLIPGGSLTAIIGAAAAALLALWRIVAGIKKAGRDEQLAKEAKSRAQNLDRIKRAADARPVGSLHDDPHNRDR